MKNLETHEIWFITGSQHLYGDETITEVAAHSQKIVEELNGSQRLPLKLVFKPTMTRPEEIRALCLEANNAAKCAGLILWMHTFSPSKMWIGGLLSLRKPFLHLHTQFNRDLPWSEIDMDFMNLNQSAHGDREAGFIHTRLRLDRKVVVGHWSDIEVQDRIAAWMRVARAWADWQGAKFVRFEFVSRSLSANLHWKSTNLGSAVRKIRYVKMCAVLVSGHGPFVWGPNGRKAVENAYALEIIAEMALKAIQLNPQVQPIASHLMDKHFRRKHGTNAYYGQA